VLIREHHPGYIDWETYEANQTRLGQNTRPRPHQGGGAVREGSALLQGLATCGHCGRRLRTHYSGNNATPGYHCAGKQIVDGRGCYCLNVGGVQIDAAVAKAFLEALTPAGIEAVVLAAEQREADQDAALAQWRLAVERTRYEAERAERRYRLVEPENRLVARGLEKEWEQRLRALARLYRGFHEALEGRAADPATLLAAVTPVPDTLSEYQFAGLLRGRRSRLRAPRTATARSCCARCSRRSSSGSNAPPPRPS